MTFEIGNPSDKCFIEADDEKVATACVLFLGYGQYFCKNVETGESYAGSFFALGGDVEQTWKHFHGIGFEEFISKPENKTKMAECYESFRYAYERTSMNNIGRKAEILAKQIRDSENKEGVHDPRRT